MSKEAHVFSLGKHQVDAWYGGILIDPECVALPDGGRRFSAGLWYKGKAYRATADGSNLQEAMIIWCDRIAYDITHDRPVKKTLWNQG